MTSKVIDNQLPVNRESNEMEINMESKFQFTNPMLNSLTFNINNDFIPKDNTLVYTKVKVKTLERGDTRAKVSLILEIGDKTAAAPFYIEAEEVSDFKWDESMESETVEKMLKQNAPALLLSYLRPIITQITAVSVYGAFHVPFMNFDTEAESK